MRTLLILALMTWALSAEAQPARGPGVRGDRAQLEARVRQEFARIVRDRVGLTDAQMAQLGPVNARYATQRRELQMEERSARQAVQQAIRNPDAADTTEVGALLQRLIDLQKRRVALLEAEQRDLGRIMNPIQRARYMALQEQVRRQIEQRRERGGGPPPGRRRLPPL